VNPAIEVVLALLQTDPDVRDKVPTARPDPVFDILSRVNLLDTFIPIDVAEASGTTTVRLNCSWIPCLDIKVVDVTISVRPSVKVNTSTARVVDVDRAEVA